ncbi:MAG: hypothetical protein Tsb0013_11660 [Phycisphaerales bacterium]
MRMGMARLLVSCGWVGGNPTSGERVGGAGSVRMVPGRAVRAVGGAVDCQTGTIAGGPNSGPPYRKCAMSDEQQDQPKIIIDSDWKAEAQAEKEKLAQQEAEQQASGAGAAGQGKLPPADFRTLMGMLASQAIMYLGGIADPQTGKAMFDPEAATHLIDLLSVLEEKTKGNLTDEESQELVGVIHELRSRFVEIAQMVAKQQGAGGAPGGAGQGPITG